MILAKGVNCRLTDRLAGSVLFLLVMTIAATAAWSYDFQGELSRRDRLWVEETLGSLDVERLIGQLFFPWYEPLESERLVVEYGIGGFVLGRQDALSIARNTNRLQALSYLPLLFCADLEAGVGARADGATLLPLNMALGATGDTELAFRCGQVTGAEARALGIHWILAPVVDVNSVLNNPVIGPRSYGEDPSLVVKLAQSFIQGANAQGVLCTLKHFPGHGGATTDSHKIMSIIWGNQEDILIRDVSVFQELIALLPNQSVMTAHIWVPALDGFPRPATLSPPVLSNLLRRQLNFDGIIISDSLTMGGITNRYSQEEAIVLALKAGVDVILNARDVPRGIEVARAAFESGELNLERLRSSVRRILEAKARVGLNQERFADLGQVGKVVGAETHLQVADTVARRALTLVRTVPGVLPLFGDADEQPLLITLETGREPLFRTSSRYFSNRLFSYQTFLREVRIGSQATAEEIQEALALAADVDKVIVASFVWGEMDNPKLTRFILDLLEMDRPVIFVSFGSPYLLAEIPELNIYLCTYSHDPASQVAAADFLYGRIEAPGRLPISFPGWIEMEQTGFALER